MRKPIFLLLAIFLTGCTSFPVQGRIEQGEEFIGVATSFGGGGTLKVTTDNTISCEGKYTMDSAFFSNQADGKGELKCADGRTGSFSVTGTYASGYGFGRLSDGKKFKFVYGSGGQVMHYDMR